jgi:hypothetical protein
VKHWQRYVHGAAEPTVAVYTQADLDNLKGVLEREANNLALAYGMSTAVSDPDYQPAQEAYRQWLGDYATWALNPAGLLLGDLFLAGQALITRAQDLEKRVANLGAPVPFPVQPVKPGLPTSSDLFAGAEAGMMGIAAVVLLYLWSKR